MSHTGSSRERTPAAGDHQRAMPAEPAVVDFRVHPDWQGDRTCVLTVTGELDIAAAPQLRQVVQDVLEREPSRLVVDLDHVTFLDSTGLGALISAHQRMLDQTGRLVLVCNQAACLRVMEITGLTRVFAFAPSTSEALAGPEAENDSSPSSS